MKKTAIIFATLALLTACGPTKDDYNALEQERDQLQSKVWELESTVNELEEENLRLKQAYNKLKNKVSQRNCDVFNLQNKVNELERENSNLERELEWEKRKNGNRWP